MKAREARDSRDGDSPMPSDVVDDIDEAVPKGYQQDQQDLLIPTIPTRTPSTHTKGLNKKLRHVLRVTCAWKTLL